MAKYLRKQGTMNFTTYLTEAVSNMEPNRGIYGQVVSNYFTLENVRFSEKIVITEIKYLDLHFDKEEDRLEFSFRLFYKKYIFAEVDIEFHNPFQFEFIGNQENNTNIEESIELLDSGIFDNIFKFEFTDGSLVFQAKNEAIDFKIKTLYRTFSIDIDFFNTTKFIDNIEKRDKNNEFFHTICNEITNEQLTAIAKGEYYFKEESVYAELVTIKETYLIPKEIDFTTYSALSFTSFNQPNTKAEHVERLFACTVILLGDYDFTDYAYIGNILIPIFSSATALGKNYVKQARAFFLNLIAIQTPILRYLILACDLYLKDEELAKETFVSLKETHFLKELDFEDDVASTAKKLEKSTLIMQEKCGFILDKSFLKELNFLFENVILICKERYDIDAINALFERTFSKEEQEIYLSLLPELLNIQYKNREHYLVNKGLNSKQTQIITRSLFKAECFLDGSDYEIDLNRNIFFEAWLKIYKKDK